MFCVCLSLRVVLKTTRGVKAGLIVRCLVWKVLNNGSSVGSCVWITDDVV